jgi:hypothetical protein
MIPGSTRAAAGVFSPGTGGRLSSQDPALRSAWRSRRPALPEPSAVVRPDPAAEVLGSRCEPDGSICGPYEQTYPIHHGYAIERTVIRPS